MLNKKQRYVLMGMLVCATLILCFYRNYQLAAITGFTFLLLLYSHIRHGSIVLASKAFTNKDFQLASSYLDETSNPDRLAKNRRGFYEFMRGNIALKRNDSEAAEAHFQIASRFPLRNKNDKAYVLIHLATLALKKHDVERVNAYLSAAEKYAETTRAKELITRIRNTKIQ